VSPSSGFSFGSQVVTLTGATGFSLDSDDIFFCSFTCGGMERFSPTGMAIENVSYALCQLPRWPGHACTANVSLWRFGIIRLAGEGEFAFLTGWRNTFPRSSPNGGGQTITLEGAGFDIVVKYVCRFTVVANASDLPPSYWGCSEECEDNSAANMSNCLSRCSAVRSVSSVTSPVTVLQPNTVVCESPQWIYGGSSQAVLSLEMLSVDGRSQVVPKITSENFVFEYAQGGATVMEPTSGLVSGGLNITVTGAGFQYPAHRTGYSANFSEAQGLYSTATVCMPVSNTTLVCPVPKWDFEESVVVLTIYQGETCVPTLNRRPFVFAFLAGISFPQIFLRIFLLLPPPDLATLKCMTHSLHLPSFPQNGLQRLKIVGQSRAAT